MKNKEKDTSEQNTDTNSEVSINPFVREQELLRLFNTTKDAKYLEELKKLQKGEEG